MTTGAPNTPASATNVGTANAAVIDLTIPRGADGTGGGGGAVASWDDPTLAGFKGWTIAPAMVGTTTSGFGGNSIVGIGLRVAESGPITQIGIGTNSTASSTMDAYFAIYDTNWDLVASAYAPVGTFTGQNTLLLLNATSVKDAVAGQVYYALAFGGTQASSIGWMAYAGSANGAKNFAPDSLPVSWTKAFSQTGLTRSGTSAMVPPSSLAGIFVPGGVTTFSSIPFIVVR